MIKVMLIDWAATAVRYSGMASPSLFASVSPRGSPGGVEYLLGLNCLKSRFTTQGLYELQCIQVNTG